MPQGHEMFIQGENYDVYIFDPEAESDEDLLTPSDETIFHVRSRVSGQMLSFIGLTTFKSDPLFTTEVKNAISRVVQYGGKDEDVSALLPNARIELGGSSNSARGTMINYGRFLNDRLGRTETRADDDPSLLRELRPVAHYHNRQHLFGTIFTPISLLHGKANVELPYEDYQSLMSEVETLYKKTGANSLFSHHLETLINEFSPRVIDKDGYAAILREEDSAFSSHSSSAMMSGFFRFLQDATRSVVFHHDNEEDILRFAKAANRVAHISPNEHVLQRITRAMTVEVPDGTDDQPHPAAVAAARMLSNGNPYLSAEDLLASKLLQPRTSPFPIQESEIPNWELVTDTLTPDAIRKLSLAKSPEGMRNIFQLAERLEWSRSLFSEWGSEKASIFNNSVSHIFWGDIEAGKPLRHILRGTIDQNARLKSPDPLPGDRGLSKRSINLYLNNAMAIDAINLAFKEQVACPPQTLYTDSGERYVISLSGKGPVPTANVVHYNADENIVFEHNGDVPTKAWAALEFKNLFKDPLHFLQLPPGKISSFQELKAVVGSMTNNKTLSRMMAKGYLAHLDQKRDEQGRKVSRKDYQSWMEPVIKQADNPNDFHAYLSEQYAKDSDDIAEDIHISLFLHLAKKSGLRVGSQYTADDLASEESNNMEKENAFTLNDLDLDFPDTRQLELTSRSNSDINYKKDIVEKANLLHHIGASLVKKHMPQVDLEWEPATNIVHLGATEDGCTYRAHPLSSYGEIQRHGRDMNHCAGTYAHLCMKGLYYLWSITETDIHGNEKEVSTLGMNLDSDSLEFDQHFGRNNSNVPEPLHSMVRQLADDLSLVTQGEDYLDEWGYDHDEEEHASDGYEDDEPTEPHYNVRFNQTGYQGGDELESEEVAELIANYHWQGDSFGQDAMRLLSEVYGEEAVKEALIQTVDENLSYYDDESPREIVDKLEYLKTYIQDYDLHRQVSFQQAI